MTAPARYDAICFCAHPDDCEMAMGGTLALLTRAKKRVLVVTLTRSDKSTFGDPENRSREFERAMEILGTDGRQLDFLDTRVVNDDASRQVLLPIIREHRPAIVFAPYHTNEAGHHDGRANIDHMETGRLVRDSVKLARLRAVRPDIPAHDVRRIFYYMVPHEVRPHFAVDVSEVEETFMAAIRAYGSQMAIRRSETPVEEILLLHRRHAGLQIGVRLAEAFLADQVPDVRVEELFR